MTNQTTPAMFATTPAERIATVARCRSTGAWGVYTDLGFGRGRVEADGVTALVSSGVNGWNVAILGPNRGHFVGCDADLETAVQLALEAA
jgi:hypothetical protein